MNSKNGILLLAITVFMVLAASSEAEAQWRPSSQPSQKFFRLAGHGFSAGYHWRTPGHCSDYYQPYSYQNTHRVAHRYGLGGQPRSGYPQDSFEPWQSPYESQGQTKEGSVLEKMPPASAGIGSDDSAPAIRRPTEPPSSPRPTDNQWPFDFD